MSAADITRDDQETFDTRRGLIYHARARNPAADPSPQTFTDDGLHFHAEAEHEFPQAETKPASFDELVEQHHQKVYTLIYRYIGDPDEAADLTQDTFIRAYQAYHRFRGDSTVYTWLYRIAINLCNNRVKQLQRRRRMEAESLDAPIEIDQDTLKREVADWSLAPDRLVETRELGRLLQKFIYSLPPDHRAVILLRDVHGLSYAEIATVTDSTLKAVKSRLFRARSQLQKMLQPYLEGRLHS